MKSLFSHVGWRIALLGALIILLLAAGYTLTRMFITVTALPLLSFTGG